MQARGVSANSVGKGVNTPGDGEWLSITSSRLP